MKNTKKKGFRIKKGIKKLFNKETRKNKIYALILVLIGFITMKISNDGTVLAISLMLGLPLFFVKENYID